MNFLVWFNILYSFENDLKLGIVKEVHRYPLNDYLEIITDEELVKKGLPKLLIPHILIKYVLDVNVDDKRINVINLRYIRKFININFLIITSWIKFFFCKFKFISLFKTFIKVYLINYLFQFHF